MESSENPEGPVRSDQSERRTQEHNRGRKRGSTALTLTCADSESHDHSVDHWNDFKRPRTQLPGGGSDVRDRSNDRDLNFKKPRGLPKRRHRPQKHTTTGSTPTESVLSRVMTTPTPSHTPPTYASTPPPALPTFSPVVRKAWADYDEEDERRIYEEDPSTLFLDFEQVPHHPLVLPLTLQPPLNSSPLLSVEEAHVGTLPPLTSAEALVENLTEGRAAQYPSLPTVMNSVREEKRREKRSLFSLIRDLHLLSDPEREEKEKVVELLRREDEKRRERERVHGGLEKNTEQDFMSLFKDIEMTGSRGRQRITFFMEVGTRRSPFSKDLDEKLARFVFLGEQQVIREETDRLCRYEKLLDEWGEAFKGQDHVVSWVGELLKEMLAEVRKDITYLTRLGRIQTQWFLPSKHCSGMSLSAFRKLKKKMLEKVRLHIAGLKRLETVQDHWFFLCKDYNKPTALSTFGKLYQTRSGKKSQSVAVQNTRKWLRHLHTRRTTAAGAHGRGRRGLKASGHRLSPQFTHHSSLTLKEGDMTDLTTVTVLSSSNLN